MFRETPAGEIDAVLARLPPGLEALYLEYLDRLPGVKRLWGNLYRRILGTLKVAQEPLTVTELTTLTKRRETKVLDGMTTLSQSAGC